MAAERLMRDAPPRPTAGSPTVIVVTGRSRPGECGVADYSAELVQVLRTEGVAVRQAGIERLGELPAFVRGLAPGSIVHLQYPLLAWRKSLLPIVLAAWLRLSGRHRLASTIHEFSRAHWARRLMCVLLARLSSLVIVTTDYEARRLQTHLRQGQALAVLPIASNIAPGGEPVAATARRGIVHFGLLAPDKGLESFLDVVEPWLRDGSTVPVTVAGTLVPGHEAWLQDLRNRFPRARYLQSLTSAEVSDVLGAASIAVLPYPDGISERRGSALAALAHGMQVVTTRGPATTDDLAAVCHLVSGAAEARAVTERLLSNPDAGIDPAAIALYNVSRSWPVIAGHQARLYRTLGTDAEVSSWS